MKILTYASVCYDFIFRHLHFIWPFLLRMLGYLKRTREIRHYSADSEYLYSTYESKYYLHCNWGLPNQHIGFFLDGYFHSGVNAPINGNGVLTDEPVPYFVSEMKMITNVAP